MKRVKRRIRKRYYKWLYGEMITKVPAPLKRKLKM